MRLLSLAALALLFPWCGGSSAAAADTTTTTVNILLFDGVQIIDFAAPYEVFGQAGFKVHTVSADGKPVTTAMKLKAGADYSFDNAPAADIVVIPGGEVHAAHDDQATLAWIRKQAGDAEHVLSICTGSFILASTGLLDGESATTFHKAFDSMAEQFPKVRIVRDQRWVDSGKLVTSAGLASGIDAALHVVAQVRGLDAARAVALHLEYDWSPEQGFVRGLLADQFMRLPEGLELPKDTVIDRVSGGIGDRRHWVIGFTVKSALSPQALLAYLAAAADKDATLTVLAQPDPRKLAWTYQAERGGRWQLSFEVADGAKAQSYPMTGTVIALD